MSDHRPYHHGALRQALIDAAETILAERGVEGLSLRDCARRIGVSHAAPKHHFADKTALLTAVAAEGYRAMTDIMDRRRTQAGDDPEIALRAVGLGYIEFAASRPSSFRLMFGETTLRANDAELERAAEAAFGRLEQTMAAVERAHGVQTQSPRERRMLAWTSVHGFATLWLAGRLQNAFGIGDDVESALAVADQFLAVVRPWRV